MQNMSVLTMKPLGQQLVEAGLLSEEQLSQALSAQKSQPDKLLGQVLVESGLLSQEAFDGFMQRRMGIQQPLGELLIQKAAITRDQLNQALAVQMQLGPASKPLGQLLVEQGAITQAELDAIIQQQFAEQEALREKLTRSGQEKTPYERSQIEDIQNLVSSGLIFLCLGQQLLPEASRLISERFNALNGLYSGPREALPEAAEDTAASFMVHFLPLLETGFQLEQVDWELEQRNQVVSQGFYALMEAFQRLLLPQMKLFSSFYLNSLIMTDATDIISLREALYIVARSPYLIPHGSLMALRFLLNEFWGQRSILEDKGVQIVRNEDEIDLSDFFRPRMEDAEDDLRYIDYMADYIHNQLEYHTDLLRNSTAAERPQRLHTLMNLYRVLLQSQRDRKEIQQHEQAG